MTGDIVPVTNIKDVNNATEREKNAQRKGTCSHNVINPKHPFPSSSSK